MNATPNSSAPARDHSKTPVRLALSHAERLHLTGPNWRRLGLDADAYPILSPALLAECEQPITFRGEQYADAVAELNSLWNAISRTTDCYDGCDDAVGEEPVVWAARAMEAVTSIQRRVADCGKALGMVPF